jgi:hypothetical protein
VADKVDFPESICRPQVYVQDEHAVVDVIAIALLSRNNISDNEADTWWRSNRSSVLVPKTAHSSAARLLHHTELISLSIINDRPWKRVWSMGCSPRCQRRKSISRMHSLGYGSS